MSENVNQSGMRNYASIHDDADDSPHFTTPPALIDPPDHRPPPQNPGYSSSYENSYDNDGSCEDIRSNATGENPVQERPFLPQNYEEFKQVLRNLTHIVGKRCICCTVVFLVLLVICISTAVGLSNHGNGSPKVIDIIIPPNVTNCPPNITRSVPPEGPDCVPVWWVEPWATNPSGGKIEYEANHQPGESFCIGETTVRYNFTGDDEVQSTCQFEILVILIDMEPPLISNCINDTVYRTPANDNGVKVWWTEPTASSASGRTVTMVKSDLEHPPGSKFPIGTTIINYIFVDSIGLQNSCSFLITVIDLIPPVVYQCPKEEIIFDVDSELDPVPVFWKTPYAIDNSGNVTLINCTHTPGSFFHVGSTQVRYVFADPTGNIALCTFTVTGKLRSTPSSGIQITSSRAFAFALIIVGIVIGNWY